jgi:hypothetical protein
MGKQLANSEVLEAASMAVAVRKLPEGTVTGKVTLKFELQPLPVVTVVEPMKV